MCIRGRQGSSPDRPRRLHCNCDHVHGKDRNRSTKSVTGTLGLHKLVAKERGQARSGEHAEREWREKAVKEMLRVNLPRPVKAFQLARRNAISFLLQRLARAIPTPAR